MRCFVVAGFLLTSASRSPSAIAELLVGHGVGLYKYSNCSLSTFQKLQNQVKRCGLWPFSLATSTCSVKTTEFLTNCVTMSAVKCIWGRDAMNLLRFCSRYARYYDDCSNHLYVLSLFVTSAAGDCCCVFWEEFIAHVIRQRRWWQSPPQLPSVGRPQLHLSAKLCLLSSVDYWYCRSAGLDCIAATQPRRSLNDATDVSMAMSASRLFLRSRVIAIKR